MARLEWQRLLNPALLSALNSKHSRSEFCKAEGGRFCKGCRLGKDLRTGKKVDGPVQRAVEVIALGGALGGRARVRVGRGGTGGLEQRGLFQDFQRRSGIEYFLLTSPCAARDVAG